MHGWGLNLAGGRSPWQEPPKLFVCVGVFVCFFLVCVCVCLFVVVLGGEFLFVP